MQPAVHEISAKSTTLSASYHHFNWIHLFLTNSTLKGEERQRNVNYLPFSRQFEAGASYPPPCCPAIGGSHQFDQAAARDST